MWNSSRPDGFYNILPDPIEEPVHWARPNEFYVDFPTKLKNSSRPGEFYMDFPAGL